jgi:hypothetical protein
MFVFSEANFTEASIASSISHAGQLPGTDIGPGNSYFVLPTGRVELADDHAVFSPTRGRAVRVYRDPRAQSGSAGQPTSQAAFPTTTFTFNAPLRRFRLFNGILAIVHLLLAGILLVAGILVLRGHGVSRKLHLWWAVLKIPTAIGAGIVSGIMMRSMMAASGAPAMPVGVFVGVISVAGLGVACIYPIALLIVMNTSAVKQFYKSALIR